MSEPKACLELLSMLMPQSPSWEGVAPSRSIPTVSNSKRPGRLVRAAGSVDREFRVDLRHALGNADHRSTSSRGGRKPPLIGRDDVLGALAGVGTLAELFVYGYLGMLKSDSILLFEREAYREGVGDGLFLSVAFDEFQGVFACAWRAYQVNQVEVSVHGLAVMLGCSRDRAKRLLGVFSQAVSLLNTLEAVVCARLSRQLFYQQEVA